MGAFSWWGMRDMNNKKYTLRGVYYSLMAVLERQITNQSI